MLVILVVELLAEAGNLVDDTKAQFNLAGSEHTEVLWINNDRNAIPPPSVSEPASVYSTPIALKGFLSVVVTFYRAIFCRARLCYGKSSVRLSLSLRLSVFDVDIP